MGNRDRALRSGFDFIDFWAIDFNWQPGKPFTHDRTQRPSSPCRKSRRSSHHRSQSQSLADRPTYDRPFETGAKPSTSEPATPPFSFSITGLDMPTAKPHPKADIATPIPIRYKLKFETHVQSDFWEYVSCLTRQGMAILLLTERCGIYCRTVLR